MFNRGLFEEDMEWDENNHWMNPPVNIENLRCEVGEPCIIEVKVN